MTSVFLSYARDDDEPFVRRLYADLTARGFDVWFDRVSMPARQLSFTQEIKDAIAARDRLVLVVGPGAAVRPYVLMEWAEALLLDKCVNPIVRRDGQHPDGRAVDAYSLIPEELRFIHAEDFRRDAEYTEHLEKLVRQLSDPAPPLGKLVAVPTLPSHYRAQPDRLRSLRDALLIDLRSPVVVTGAAARMGVQGMGGIGKSVLANALARDLQVRRAFPDGIFWIPVGQQPTIVELQRQVATALGDEALFNDVHAGKETLRALLANRAALLVLDNVWRRSDAHAFDVLGQRCKLLLTTRDAGLVISMAGTHYQMQLPTEAEALALLASAAHVAVESLPALAADVVRECGRLPLALALCGGMRQAGTAWRDLLDALREHDLEFPADEHAAEDQHRNLWRAMGLSVRILPEDQQQRFAELAVFAAGARVPEAAVLTLWAHTGGLSERHARRLLVELSQRSLVLLAHRTGVGVDDSATVGLHDLLHDFAMRLAGQRFVTVAALHEQLLEAYRRTCSSDWPSGPNDGYFFDHLRDHLVEAGKVDELCRLLLDLAWLEKKAAIGLVFDLPRDYAECLRVCPSDDALRRNIRLLEQAIRRDIHFIARHPSTLFQCLWNSCWWYDCAEAAQHYQSADGPWNRPGDKLSALLEAWRAQKEHATPGFVWMMSMRPPAEPIGGGQIGSLIGHLRAVCDVVFFPSGDRIATASLDDSAFIWNAYDGHPDLHLEGHAGEVVAVAVAHDGSFVVTGSSDRSVRVWDCATGTMLRSLSVSEGSVTCVALSPADDLVACGAMDGMVRIWKTDSGTLACTVQAHRGWVKSVAFSPRTGEVATGGTDGAIRLWDPATGELRRELVGHTGQVTDLGFFSHGEHLISCSGDATVREWRPETGEQLLVMRRDSEVFNCVDVSPDSNLIASADRKGGISVWDAASGVLRKHWQTESGPVLGIGFSPRGDCLATAHADGSTRIWDFNLVTSRPSRSDPTLDVLRVAFLDEGRFVACYAATRLVLSLVVSVWDVARSRFLRPEEAGPRIPYDADDPHSQTPPPGLETGIRIANLERDIGWIPLGLGRMSVEPQRNLWAGTWGRHFEIYQLRGTVG